MSQTDLELKHLEGDQLLQGGIFALLLLALLLPTIARAGDTETDNALWAGALLLSERKDGLDYSVEYQLREGDNISSLNSQFVEVLGYHKQGPNLILNGGYRYTRRHGETEHRLYAGGFFDLTRTSRGLEMNPDVFRATLQVGYQHDFDVEFDNERMDSDSMRFILVGSKRLSERWRPFLLGGVLTTWNDAYSFGVDKIRLGGGAHYQFSPNSRLRIQYIWEKLKFREPEKQNNIFWLRYERRF